MFFLPRSADKSADPDIPVSMGILDHRSDLPADRCCNAMFTAARIYPESAGRWRPSGVFVFLLLIAPTASVIPIRDVTRRAAPVYLPPFIRTDSDCTGVVAPVAVRASSGDFVGGDSGVHGAYLAAQRSVVQPYGAVAGHRDEVTGKDASEGFSWPSQFSRGRLRVFRKEFRNHLAARHSGLPLARRLGQCAGLASTAGRL